MFEFGHKLPFGEEGRDFILRGLASVQESVDFGTVTLTEGLAGNSMSLHEMLRALGFSAVKALQHRQLQVDLLRPLLQDWLGELVTCVCNDGEPGVDVSQLNHAVQVLRLIAGPCGVEAFTASLGDGCCCSSSTDLVRAELRRAQRLHRMREQARTTPVPQYRLTAPGTDLTRWP